MQRFPDQLRYIKVMQWVFLLNDRLLNVEVLELSYLQEEYDANKFGLSVTQVDIKSNQMLTFR